MSRTSHRWRYPVAQISFATDFGIFLFFIDETWIRWNLVFKSKFTLLRYLFIIYFRSVKNLFRLCDPTEEDCKHNVNYTLYVYYRKSENFNNTINTKISTCWSDKPFDFYITGSITGSISGSIYRIYFQDLFTGYITGSISINRILFCFPTSPGYHQAWIKGMISWQMVLTAGFWFKSWFELWESFFWFRKYWIYP